MAVLALVPNPPGKIATGEIGHRLFGAEPTDEQVRSMGLAVRSLAAKGLVTIEHRPYPMWVDRDGRRGRGRFGPNLISKVASDS